MIGTFAVPPSDSILSVSLTTPNALGLNQILTLSESSTIAGNKTVVVSTLNILFPREILIIVSGHVDLFIILIIYVG